MEFERVDQRPYEAGGVADVGIVDQTDQVT
jgi:hypothetical protein